MGLFDMENKVTSAVEPVAAATQPTDMQRVAAPAKLTKSQQGTADKNTIMQWIAANQSAVPSEVLEAAKRWAPTAFGIVNHGGNGGIAPTYFTSAQRKALDLFGGDASNEVPEAFDGLVGRTVTEDEVFAKLKMGRGEMRGFMRELVKTPKNIARSVNVSFDSSTGVYTLTSVTPYVAPVPTTANVQ